MVPQKGRPAFVDVTGARIRFCLAGVTPDGAYGVPADAKWRDLGYIEEGVAVIEGVRRRQWVATDSTGTKAVGKTKRQAVEAILAKLALYEVTLNDATPPLFD